MECHAVEMSRSGKIAQLKFAQYRRRAIEIFIALRICRANGCCADGMSRKKKVAQIGISPSPAAALLRFICLFFFLFMSMT